MKEPSSPRHDLLRRVAEAERKLEKKESEIRELRSELSGIAEALRASEEAAPPPEELRWEAVEEPNVAMEPVNAVAEPPRPEAPPPRTVTPPPLPVEAAAVTPPVQPVLTAVEPVAPPVQPVPPSKSTAQALPGPFEASVPPPRTEMDLETRIGAVWFNRIGLVAIIIGVVLFARYFHQQLQPWHKVAGGYAAALALFLTGWLLEKRVRLFARPVMAGGLALAFFTSFGAHFLKPMECLPLAPSLVLMSLAIFGVFLCAERWESEPTAGFAIFLGHVAAYVAGGDADTFSLVAILFLSASAVVLFLRHDWAPLSLFAVAAAYGSHFLWAIQEHPASRPQTRFWANFTFFTSYHAIFLAADLVYRHRIWRNRERYTRAQKASARAVGPVSLVLYATFAAGIFRVTDVYWTSIHLWLFPLAALELLVAGYHRSRSSEDAPFHATAATVLATLGLFAWQRGLTLNLMLAAEALMLLLLARRLRIGFLHPLAQAVLGVNFVHYWLSDAREMRDWPAFLGSGATALVYFVKSRLEETWDALPPEEDAGELPGGRFAAALRELFRRAARPVACLQAVLGGVLLSYSSQAFFAMPWDGVALGSFAAAAAVCAVFFRSDALTFALGAMEVGLTITFLAHVAGEQFLKNRLLEILPGPRAIWLADQTAITVLSACVSFVLLKAQGWKHRTGRAGSVLSLILLSLPAGLACQAGEPIAWLFPLWLAAPAALWLATETWHRGGRWAFGMLGSVLTVHAASASLESETAAVWLLSSLAVAILLGAIACDAPRFVPGIASLLALTGGYLAFSLLDGGIAPDDLPLWAGATAPLLAAATLIAGAQLRRRGSFAVGGLAAFAIGAGTLVFLALEREVTFSPLLLWLLTALVFWLTSEPLRKTFLRPLEEFQGWKDRLALDSLREAAPFVSMTISLAGALFLLLITVRHFTGDRPEALVGAESAYAIVFLAAAVIFRSPSLAGAYAFSLSAAFAIFAATMYLPDGDRAALAHPYLTISLAGVALLAGGVVEWVYLRRNATWQDAGRSWAAAGVWYPYVLSLLVGSWYFEVWGPEITGGGAATRGPSRAIFALLFFGIGWLLRLPWLQLASHAAALVATILLARSGVTSLGRIAGLPQAGLAVSIVLLILERLTVNRQRDAANLHAAHLQDFLRIASVVTSAGLMLLTLYLSKELEGSWTTFGWSIVALAFAGLGFLWKDRNYRRTGLAVFGLTLVRAVLVDVQELEIFYRMLAFLCLGGCLLAVSFLYTKFREEIGKWL